MRNGSWFFLPAAALLGAALLMNACATVDYTASRVASAVDRYCATTDPLERQYLRQALDAKTDHRVRVECAE